MLNKPSSSAEAEQPEQTSEEFFAERIVHILKIYPRISPSMMQMGIGGFPAASWKPVLHSLIERKIVLQEFQVDVSAAGRNQTYTILSLNPNTFEE